MTQSAEIRGGASTAGESGQEDLRRRVNRCYGGEVRWNESLAGYTTLRVGGPAAAVVMPATVEELAGLIRGLEGVPWWVIGRGSNILVPDEGLAGVVIVMDRNLTAITVIESRDDTVLVRVQAGCGLAPLIRWTVEQGFSGLEFACGIPGTVGGAVIMNAGAWGREISEVIRSLTVMDRSGELAEIAATDAAFSYRKSSGLDRLIVVDAVFRLMVKEPETVDQACQDALRKRMARQPLRCHSAGSFFRNPADEPAGRLIERAGLKGYRIGGAIVSEKHANFIVNTGSASAADIYALMREIQKRVYDISGIMLEPEVRLLGRWSTESQKRDRAASSDS